MFTVKEEKSLMRKLILAFAIACAFILPTRSASAEDWFCGFYCSGNWGSGVCQGPAPPTAGCSYVGGLGDCIGGSPSLCGGGGMGCGFDGQICAPDQQFP